MDVMVVNIAQGCGKDAGCVVYTCKTGDNEFNVV